MDDRIHVPGAVATLRNLYTGVLARFPADIAPGRYLDETSATLLDLHMSRNPAAAVQISNWHPDRIGLAADRILAEPFDAGDARLVVAREHGWRSWEDALAGLPEAFDAGFERAVDALLAGEATLLSRALDEEPGLVAKRSCFGHRATLLHYCAANGVETWRQVVPLNLAEAVRLLLDRGADARATAPFYGGEHTAHELFASSAHPLDAGVFDEVGPLLRAG